MSLLTTRRSSALSEAVSTAISVGAYLANRSAMSGALIRTAVAAALPGSVFLHEREAKRKKGMAIATRTMFNLAVIGTS